MVEFVGDRADPFTDAWDFLSRAVWTEDQASGRVRQFPYHLEYVRELVRQRDGCPIFCVEKSRRMVCSWTFCALYLYDTLTQPNHANYIGSRALGPSSELVDRLVFIHEHIPASVWPDKPAIKTYAGPGGQGTGVVEVPSIGSFCRAVAQGKDQLRQFTASNILLDEFAFWEKAEESWGALKPTVQGGGHIDIISTPELGSFMYRLIYEEI